LRIMKEKKLFKESDRIGKRQENETVRAVIIFLFLSLALVGAIAVIITLVTLDK
jgi:hypothetical protein